MFVHYGDLKRFYPTMEKKALFDLLGGEWPLLVSNPNYNNTCAVRLSFAMIKSGMSIPKKHREGIDGDNNNLIIKVATFNLFLTNLIGDFDWGMSKPPGSSISVSDLPKQTGIIIYHVHWDDATGHIDLWDRNNFIGSGNFDDIKDGYSVHLWKVD